MMKGGSKMENETEVEEYDDEEEEIDIGDCAMVSDFGEEIQYWL